ncbi:hypothetical protein [Microbacterium sp.]|uniref:hypothetical protein n=1 Tax=Microbacterium sp. TaxID=51671 RepID=UPI00261F1334|nr:hypothetical protein [uncultured Microbacterium sp.]
MGVLALGLSTAQIVVFAIVPVDALPRFLAIGMFFALLACWFAANWYFVRRG